jgi:superkiller protein 3
VQERLRRAELERAASEARAVAAQATAAAEHRARRRTVLLATVVVAVAAAAGAAAWWVALRRAETEQAVTAALGAVQARRERAWLGPPGDLHLYSEAVEVARRGSELARTGFAGAALRDRARQALAEAEADLVAAGRDQDLLARLLAVRQDSFVPSFQEGESGGLVRAEEPDAEDQFADAFRDYGLDVTAAPDGQVVERLKGRPPAVVQEVIAALDDWAVDRRYRPGADWQRLLRLADTLDAGDGHDGRRELRAVLTRDRLWRERLTLGVRLVGTAAGPLPLVPDLAGPWPGEDRYAVRLLARDPDAARGPVLAVLLLARALVLAGDGGTAEQLYRAAVRARPDEAILQTALGKFLERRGRWPEAVAAYAAARALRPEAGRLLARALDGAGHAPEALAERQELVRRQPANPVLWHDLALARHRLGRVAEAEADYRQALRLRPDYAIAHYNLGNALKDQGRLAEAEQAYRDALRLRPDYAKAHNNLGLTFSGRKRYADAEAAYRRALDAQPDLGVALTNLARALRGQGKHADAVAVLEPALRRRPEFAEAAHALGVSLIELQRHAEAEAVLRQAVRHKPNDPAAWFSLGAALKGQNRPAEAEAAYRESLRLEPEHSTYRQLGHTLLERGRLADAETALREGLRLQPNDARAWFFLGLVLADLRRPADATQAFREAVRHQPDFAEAHYNLGRQLSAGGRPAEAEASYRRAIRHKPDYAWAWDNLGNVLTAQGRHAEAVDAHRQAIQLQDGNPFSWHNLGIALQLANRLDEAEAASRRALRLRPDLAEVHQTLGRTLLRARKLAEAETALREAVRLKPDYANAHAGLGLVLLAQGRFADARAASRRAATLYPAGNPARARAEEDLRMAERLLEAERRLPAVLAGTEAPAGAAENLALALVCHRHQHRHAAAVGFFAAAFAANPLVATSPTMGARHRPVAGGYRSEAACAAALAAAGQGEGAADAPTDRRADWRRQALEWLRAELDARSGPTDRPLLRRIVEHWQTDPALAGVRSAEHLDKLPAGERQAWGQFWADVARTAEAAK